MRRRTGYRWNKAFRVPDHSPLRNNGLRMTPGKSGGFVRAKAKKRPVKFSQTYTTYAKKKAPRGALSVGITFRVGRSERRTWGV
jgi:hypothetical protein